MTLAHYIDVDWVREQSSERQRRCRGRRRNQRGNVREQLEGNLLSLLERAKSGQVPRAARRRVHIPKGDGLADAAHGHPNLRGKVLQRAVVWC